MNTREQIHRSQRIALLTTAALEGMDPLWEDSRQELDGQQVQLPPSGC